MVACCGCVAGPTCCGPPRASTSRRARGGPNGKSAPTLSGTSLEVAGPVQIRSAEHFTVLVQPWSCAAVPIHDPETQRVLGVVDITGSADAGSPQSLAMVRAAPRIQRPISAADGVSRQLRGDDARPDPDLGVRSPQCRGPRRRPQHTALSSPQRSRRPARRAPRRARRRGSSAKPCSARTTTAASLRTGRMSPRPRAFCSAPTCSTRGPTCSRPTSQRLRLRTAAELNSRLL